MDNNYENIVPWNGANDTGRDVRLKLQRNFSKIGINFQELEGKFTTVDELFDLIEQELEKKLSKTENDWAAGIITFLKGLIAEELIQANNGLVVRKTEVVEPMLMSLLSEEFEEGIVEENEDVFVEEMRTATGGAATLGELDNVDDEADSVSDTDDILVRLAGTSEWTINTALFSQVSQLMSKVFPFTMTLSGGGTYEKGSSQTINISWTYDRDIESQSINNESLLIGIRAKQYANVATDTTYTLKAIQGGQTYTKSVSAQFKVKKYYGVSANGTLTNDEILALSSTWAAGRKALLYSIVPVVSILITSCLHLWYLVFSFGLEDCVIQTGKKKLVKLQILSATKRVTLFIV